MQYDKIVAGFSAFTIALTSLVVPVTANAATTSFKDASSISSWAADSVSSLVEAGVLSGRPDGSFDPKGTLNRAELAKIAMLGAGLSADTTGAPHFNDVATTDWFFSFVETLYNNNVVGGINSGALDANGLATYNPAGTVNRAEAAKILVEAFNLETAHTGTAPTFTDVSSDAWYFDYVETAYAHGLLNGYGDGKFGPGDNVTREQVAVIAQASKVEAKDGSKRRDTYAAGSAKAALATTTPGDTTTPTTPAASDGTLSVVLSSKSPAAATVAKGATGIVVASYDLTASSAGDVTVTGLKVQRTGVGARGDIEALYLYDGDTKLTGSRTISADTNVAEFSSVNLTVAKGTTKTVNVVADILYTAGGSDQHAFGLTAATSVGSNAKSVTGTFPLTASTITIGGSAVGYIQVQSTGSVSNPTVGDKQVELAKLQLTAGANNVRLNKITLNNTGSAGSDKLANLKLFQGTTDLAATVTRSGDRFTFVLPTAYAIANGTNKTFTVKGDLTGGLNAQTIIFNVEEKGDIQALDEVLNTNAITFDSGDTTSSNSYSNTALQTLTIKGGDVNVSFSGPVAKNVSKGAKDAKLWEGTLAVAANATVKNTYIYLASSEPVALVSGLCDNASTANFTDIKLINTETGGTLAGPVEYSCSSDSITVSTPVTAATADTAADLTLTDDWQVEAGKTYKLAITADVRNASSNASNDITATFGSNAGGYMWSSTDLKKNDASEYLTSFVPSTKVTGNKQTVLASSLTVSVASTPTSTTLVKGAKARDLLGVNMQAGTNSDVKVTSLKFIGDASYNDAGAAVDGTVGGTATAEGVAGQKRAANVIQTVYLYDGSTLLSTKSFDTSADTVTFDNISLTIKAGATKTLTVKGDVSSNLSTASSFFALDLYNGTTQSDSTLATNVTSEDTDGNDVSETGGTKYKNITGAMNASGVATGMTLSPTGGSLTLAKDANTPTAAIILMSQLKKEVYRAKLTAATEDFRVERLSFIVDANTTTAGDNDNNISKVYLEYPDSLTTSTSTKTVEGVLSGGVVLFDITDAPMKVKKDQDAQIKVYVDTQDSTSATSKESIQFYPNLADFKAYGEGSNAVQIGSQLAINTPSSLVSYSSGTYTPSWTSFTLPLTQAAANGLTVAAGTANTTDTVTFVATSKPVRVGDMICLDSSNNGACSASDEILIATSNGTGVAAATFTAIRGAFGSAVTAETGAQAWFLGTLAASSGTINTAAAFADVDVTTALTRGQLLALTNGTYDKGNLIVVNNVSVANTQNLGSSAFVSQAKLGAAAAAGNGDTMKPISNYRPALGDFFSVAKSTAIAALASSSASGSKTVSTKDNVMAITFTNGGNFSSTLDVTSLRLNLVGSLFIDTSTATTNDNGRLEAGDLNIYENAALGDSDKVATSAQTDKAATTNEYINGITFTQVKPVEIAANSSKTLYVTVDTTDAVFVPTSSDDLLTASLTAYTWSDGVASFVAADNGYGITLPLNGNTLRY